MAVGKVVKLIASERRLKFSFSVGIISFPPCRKVNSFRKKIEMRFDYFELPHCQPGRKVNSFRKKIEIDNFFYYNFFHQSS